MTRAVAQWDAREARAPRLDDARAQLRAALGDTRAGSIVVCALRAPLAEPELLLDGDPSAAGFLWAPPSGLAASGVGAAAELRFEGPTASRGPASRFARVEGRAASRGRASRFAREEGPSRFARVRAAAEALFARLAFAGAMDAPRPRLHGGFAFTPGAATGRPWREFADASFVLPRWCYTRDADIGVEGTHHGARSTRSDIDVDDTHHGARSTRSDIRVDDTRDGRAWLAAAVPGGDARAAARAMEELEVMWRALARGDAMARDGRGAAAWSEALPHGAWATLVDGIRDEIAAGRCEKIVAARRGRVSAAERFELRRVLANLRASGATSCTRFAFRGQETAFVGATPERLVERRGARVRSEALAGSIEASDVGGAAERLLASAKDRHEHALVVRAVAAALLPVCARLDVPEIPSVRRLRHVMHLHTPISGILDGPRHVLDLVAALHPTPAVAGVPTDAAVDWIARHEPAPRGWYAAPVGWFDAAGDGAFAVALRCAVLDGTDAWIYAGAGIVRGSEPTAEYAETALKQRAIAAALGVAPGAVEEDIAQSAPRGAT